MTFGERLKQARLEKGMTQQQVADELCVAKSTYTGYEKGTREPDLFKIKRLIEILNVKSSWLLGVEEGAAGITKEEWDLIKQYRELDLRGKTAIQALLAHENLASAGDNGISDVLMA